MSRTLPDDVLHIICDQLAGQRDFHTLYLCARSSKQLSVPALTSLYRIHDSAPITNGGSDELDARRPPGSTTWTSRLAQQEQIVRKWSNMWQSIILSSLDKTMYPYCRFIRVLNLRDLGNLFEDPKFRGNLDKSFFVPDLQRFNILMDTPAKPTRQGKKQLARLNIVASIHAIGEAITQKVRVLEEISGHLRSTSLLTWIPRLSRLQTLSLWRGDALEGGVETLISEHCPLFKSLTFYEWAGNEVDEKLATFLKGLPPNTLESFQIISVSGIGPESFTALNHHATSLTDLKLSGLQTEAIHSLNNLKGCTALRTLHLEDGSGISQLETHHMDTFLETVNWLRDCKNLEDLELRKFHDGPALLTPLLLENNPSLIKVSLEGYAMTDHRQFHQALAHQTHLESLWLKGDGEDVVRDDIDVLIDSVCKLTNLKDLVLKDVSDCFRNEQISQLARSLPQLEELWTSGFGITDDIWEHFTSLTNLKSLTFYATSSFTMDGILDFIANLGPSNKGFYLSIMNADVDSNLTEAEQNQIREMLVVQLDGKFEFTLMGGSWANRIRILHMDEWVVAGGLRPLTPFMTLYRDAELERLIRERNYWRRYYQNLLS